MGWSNLKAGYYQVSSRDLSRVVVYLVFLFLTNSCIAYSTSSKEPSCTDFDVTHFIQNFKANQEEWSYSEKYATLLSVFICFEEGGSEEEIAWWYIAFLDNESQNTDNLEAVKQVLDSLAGNFFLPTAPGCKTCMMYAKLGKFYLRQQRFPYAIKYLETARNICEELGEKQELYDILCDLTHANYGTYDFETALRYERLAHSYSSFLPVETRKEKLVHCFIMRTSILYQMEKFDSVSIYLDTAAILLNKYLDEFPDYRNSMGKAYAELAFNYFKIGEIEKGNSYRNLYLTYAPNPDTTKLLNALFYFVSGNFKKAEGIIENNDSLFSGHNLWIPYEFYIKTGQLEKASSILEEEIKITEMTLRDHNRDYANINDEEFKNQERANQIERLEEKEEGLRRTMILVSVFTFFLLAIGLGYFFTSRGLAAKNAEMRKLNELTEQQLEVIKGTNAKMEDFIHTLSHNAISYIDMIINYTSPDLFEGDMSEKNKNINLYAKNLKTASMNLINYHFVQRKSGRKTVDLSKKVEEIKVEFKNYLGRVSLVSKLEATRVAGDYVKIKQVLINLIHNAVRFAREGDNSCIEIASKVWEEDPTMILLQVYDNGVGIPEENISKVFDKFFTHSKNNDGTGLGLFICKEIIENLGGTIWVESQIGEGTTFYMTLPRAL